MIEITVEGQAELSKKLQGLVNSGGGLDKIIRVFSQRIFDNIHEGAATHTKTGSLVRSLGTGPRPTQDGYQIKHDLQVAKYAKFVNYGHRAFDIVPKDKKALRFVNGGHFIFAKVVHIPEYKGDNYFQRGIDNTVRQFDQIVSENWQPFKE